MTLFAKWSAPNCFPAPVVFAALCLSAAFPTVVRAQPHVYASGTIGLHTQTHGDAEPIGGTTWGASALFGVHLAPRFSIEVEPTFSGSYSCDYSYNPGPDWTADVVVSRRDTMLSFQVRTRVMGIEPVFGLSDVIRKMSRHATTDGMPYFDEARTDERLNARHLDSTLLSSSRPASSSYPASGFL